MKTAVIAFAGNPKRIAIATVVVEAIILHVTALARCLLFDTLLLNINESYFFTSRHFVTACFKKPLKVHH